MDAVVKYQMGTVGGTQNQRQLAVGQAVTLRHNVQQLQVYCFKYLVQYIPDNSLINKTFPCINALNYYSDNNQTYDYEYYYNTH